jgi:hypothetical protein
MHRDSSHRTKTTTTTTLKPNTRSSTTEYSNYSTPTQPIRISAPIINRSDEIVINDKDQPNENSNEEQTANIENDNIEEQISILEESEKMSDEYNHTDDQVD